MAHPYGSWKGHGKGSLDFALQQLPLHSFPELYHQMYHQGDFGPSRPLTSLSTQVFPLWISRNSPDDSREGQLSEQLRDFLQHYDIEAIGEILKSRHITTTYDLEMMKDSKKADVHAAAHMMYTKILGGHYWTERRQKTLEILFCLQSICTPKRSHEEKKATVLKLSLQSKHFMEYVAHCFGQEKMIECQHWIEQSESLSRLSFLSAVHAYSAVETLPMELQGSAKKGRYVNGQWTESQAMIALKALRANIRDCAAWRLIGYLLGMDSKDAAHFMLQDALGIKESESPEGSTPFSALMNAFLTIQRDIMRAILLVQCREENLCQSTKEEDVGPDPNESTPESTTDISEMKALLLRIQQQTAKLQTDVDRMKTTMTPPENCQ
jgi:hypothetical protein